MVDICVNGDTIKNIRLFVFDKDGTMIDLYNYWYHMIELRAGGICSFYQLSVDTHKESLMFEMGVDVKSRRLRPGGPVGILPRAAVQKAAEDYLLRLNLKDVSGVCFNIFKQADELSLPRLREFIKPIKGAIDLLRQIKKKNAKIAIATTDKTERAQLAVEFLDIESLIDFIVGADRVKQSKPAPDMLILAGESLGINAENSVMVGDAKTDIQMGINANFKASIAVCSGLTGKDDLSQLTPYVIQDVSSIRIK